MEATGTDPQLRVISASYRGITASVSYMSDQRPALEPAMTAFGEMVLLWRQIVEAREQRRPPPEGSTSGSPVERAGCTFQLTIARTATCTLAEFRAKVLGPIRTQLVHALH
jgi:hypothetical protein